jgi:hypothetical protein
MQVSRLLTDADRLTWRLPSGQAIAKEDGRAGLSPADLQELSPVQGRVRALHPLGDDVLKEACGR